jgi:hypothetical protein
MDDFIETYDDTITPRNCEAICARFAASADTAPGRTGQGVDRAKKDSTDLTLEGRADWADVNRLLAQTALHHLHAYMAKYRFLLIGALAPTVSDPATGGAVTLSPDNFDRCGLPHLTGLIQAMYRCGPVNLQRYRAGSGGYHHWHSEIYPQAGSAEALHRVLLFQFYLNDVAEGGETEFAYQQRRVAPKAGRLVIAPAGFTHTHKGHVPVSGDKVIATSWILFNPVAAMPSGA